MRTISRTEAKEHFDELLDAVTRDKEPVFVERDGEEVAVILNREEFDRLLSEEDRNFWKTVDQIRLRNAATDPDEVISDLTAVVEEARRAKRRS